MERDRDVKRERERFQWLDKGGKLGKSLLLLFNHSRGGKYNNIPVIYSKTAYEIRRFHSAQNSLMLVW